MTLKLHFRTPDGEFRAVDLGSIGEGVVIGRDREVAGLVIPDPQVSRGHCEIKQSEGGLMLADLGSRNGTWLNGQNIDRSVLQRGDQIVIGGTKIKISDGGTSDEVAYELLGQTISGFEFQEIMGQGSYGTVYRGHQIALHREVAIKVLDRDHAQDPDKVSSFMLEARNAGRLNHPNVVQVHDVVQTDGQYFLVMELMTGGSMSDRMRIDGPIDAETCCNILVDIGHALAYAESQRLVHRDVKPDNILVNAEGVYKLADLGIAEPIAADGHAHQVKTFGSAHYVAPEQAMGGAIDGRADIYALGASVFHLATGRTLYQGSARQIVAAHINQPAPNLAESAPQLSSPLIELIGEMLEKESDHRPASGNDIAERVVQIVEGAVSAPAARRSGPMRVRRRRRRRRR